MALGIDINAKWATGGTVLKTRAIVPMLQFKPAEPANLLVVLESQVERLIEVGIPKEVKIAKNKFLDDAMALVHAYDYRLDLATIGLNELYVVRYDVPNEFLVETSGITSYIDLEKSYTRDGIVVPEGFAIMQGQRLKYKGLSPNDACSRMDEQREVGGNIVEGLTIYQYGGDSLLQEGYMDLPGSRSEYGDVPCLYLYGGRPVLCACGVDSAHPDDGSVSRGKYWVA